jgi:hypothetical protein
VTDPSELPVIDLGGRDVDGMGTIFGRRVEAPDAPAGAVGVITEGRPSTEENLAGARRFLLEASREDFEWRGAREVVDRASGQVYEVLGSDPLADANPAAGCDLFFVDGALIRFLRRTGVTVDELERARAEQERRAAEAEEAARKRRAREKQIPLALADLYPGDRYEVTVRAAAARLLELGGQLVVGPYGELQVTVPAKIVAGGLEVAILEQEARREAAHLAEVLATGWRVVLAGLAEVEAAGGKKSLVDVLPDRRVSIGGGVA